MGCLDHSMSRSLEAIRIDVSRCLSIESHGHTVITKDCVQYSIWNKKHSHLLSGNILYKFAKIGDNDCVHVRSIGRTHGLVCLAIHYLHWHSTGSIRSASRGDHRWTSSASPRRSSGSDRSSTLSVAVPRRASGRSADRSTESRPFDRTRACACPWSLGPSCRSTRRRTCSTWTRSRSAPLPLALRAVPPWRCAHPSMWWTTAASPPRPRADRVWTSRCTTSSSASIWRCRGSSSRSPGAWSASLCRPALAPARWTSAIVLVWRPSLGPSGTVRPRRCSAAGSGSDVVRRWWFRVAARSSAFRPTVGWLVGTADSFLVASGGVRWTR